MTFRSNPNSNIYSINSAESGTAESSQKSLRVFPSRLRSSSNSGIRWVQTNLRRFLISSNMPQFASYCYLLRDKFGFKEKRVFTCKIGRFSTNLGRSAERRRHLRYEDRSSEQSHFGCQH